MKWIGLAAVAALIAACFFPWVFIDAKNITITGVDSGGTSFGKPGYFHLLMAVFFVVLHFTKTIWAKRVNLLVAALNLAWAMRNYFIISACSGGECPQKKTALYVVLISSLLIMAAALFPQIALKDGPATDHQS
jgi:hypothetical protein